VVEFRREFRAVDAGDQRLVPAAFKGTSKQTACHVGRSVINLIFCQ
jgi:hypothetical protein